MTLFRLTLFRFFQHKEMTGEPNTDLKISVFIYMFAFI